MVDERLARLRRNASYLANEPEEQQELNSLLAAEVHIVRSVEPAGWQNLVLEAGGEQIPFHRLHNPFDECAEKMLASDSPEILICCGSGFGYQLPGLLAKAERATKIVVVETRIEPLLVFLTELELENFLSDEVEILYAPKPERLAGFLKKQFHRYHPTSLKFLSLESFGLLEPGYVDAVVVDIQDAWNRHLIYLKSMEEQHAELIRNTKQNLRGLHESHRLKKGSARGQRVAILASGPSLDYNLPLLSALGEYVHLLAVGSALVPVRECGVEPDMVIVSDPQQVNAAHFPDEEYNLQLAYDPVIPNAIVRKFRGDKLVYNMGHGIVELLASWFGLTRLRGWGTVSSSALALAAEAGFDEILLVGTDFSFFDKIVHTESYLLQSAAEDYRLAVDAAGKEVRTTETLNDYADFLNGQIRSLTESGHKIFNCCEGGLLTKGVRISLREYYSRLIHEGAKKEPWRWKEPIRTAPEVYRELIADLERMLEAAGEAIDAAARGEITASELMSMTIVSAFEGGMLPEAHALEKALIDGDRTQIERSREAMKTALGAGVRELVESLKELSRSPDGDSEETQTPGTDREQVRRAKKVTRTVGTSFIISTSGRRRDTVRRLCRTIKNSIPDPKEIVLVGAVGDERDPAVKAVDARQDSLAGRICTMRNLGGEASAGEILVFLDDDVEIDEGWYPAALPLLARLRSGTSDIGNCRVVGPNGKRWFDWCWASREDPACPPMLLPYGLVHPNLYVSGCCMIMRREVWSSVLFDEKLLNHQHDDVDFCHRCTDAGYRFSSQPSAVLVHLLEPAGRNPEDPASGPDEFSLAIHRYRQGSARDALQLLEKAEGKVQRGVYHYYRGLFLLFLRDLAAAEKHLRIAQDELDANTQRTLCGQVRYRLGLVALMRKATRESERMFRAALELVPEHPFARARLRRLSGKPMALP